ncbi:MAG TPA: helix-turn-helix domain-containing protein [Solirubrobacteraceae bacterium]|nr:helix-turn-helix domain-containing protein [Solirubrobacteraceae bacterium]
MQPPSAIELPIVDAIPKERADAQRNRQKVLVAAARLFAQEGVENVSMDMIAAEAGVGKGTLFRRFGDRAGLAQAVLEEKTVALQEAIIRGPAPLGPGAHPRERLKALAAAHLELMADRADVLAAAEFGVRLDSAPYAFYRMHVGVLVREACPEADWELLTDMLLAPLAAEMYVNWVRARAMSHERILATYGLLVDRLMP